MDADEEDMQRQIEEAMRRSRQQTTLEESLLAEALAASLTTRDEELALAMQREQVQQLEASLCRDLSADPHPTRRPAAAGPPPPPPPAVHPSPPRAARSRPNGNTHVHGSPVSRKSASRNASAFAELSPSSTIRDYSPPNNPGRISDGVHQSAHEARENAASSSPTSSTYAEAAAAMPQYKPPSLHSRRSNPNSPSSSSRTTSVSSPPRSRLQAAPLPPPVTIPFVRDNRTPEVVIDGQNVGCSYGVDNRFCARGVEIVLDYYRFNNIPAVAMVPRHKVDDRNAANPRLADDPQLLNKLSEQGRLSFTPAGAHDDYFVLHYAMKVNADIISNDRFNKELDLQETVQDARKLRSFLNEHLIPYTFVGDEFIANPKPSQLGRAIHQSRGPRR